jgi:hypothetical protein
LAVVDDLQEGVI